MILVWAGFAATLLVAWLVAVLRWQRVTRLDPTLLTASALLGVRSRALGLPLYFLAGSGLVPLAYRGGFALAGRADAATGLWLGLLHAVITGIALAFVSGAEAPGLFAHRAGALTPLLLLILHAIYGALLAYIYALPGG